VPDDCVVFIYHQSIPIRWRLFNGIDSAKATLQLQLQGRQYLLDNTPKGCAQLLQQVQALGQVQIVCEATGGYEKGLVAACHALAQPVSRLNSAQVRHFALAQGQRAKNDPLDANVLTNYGTALQPPPTPPTDPALEAMRVLLQWRDHLQEQLSRARQIAEHGLPAFVARQQKKLAAHLEQQLQTVARELAAALPRAPQLQEQVQALIQLDGVSTLTALNVLSRMPELGTLDR